jgi:hypothetical protein
LGSYSFVTTRVGFSTWQFALARPRIGRRPEGSLPREEVSEILLGFVHGGTIFAGTRAQYPNFVISLGLARMPEFVVRGDVFGRAFPTYPTPQTGFDVAGCAETFSFWRSFATRRKSFKIQGRS